MKKVLVTGGLGFIGSHTVVQLIEGGYEVTIIDNLYNSKKNVLNRIKQITGTKPTFYQFDVQDKAKLEKVFKKEKPEVVIHFAGYKAVGESVVKPLEYYENNLDTTFALLTMMKKYGCKNIVFSSSATVYGIPKKVPLTEKDPVQNATSPYGQSKLINERILSDFQAVNKDFNVVLLRYFNPIGAHKSGLLGEDPNDIPNNLLPYINKVAVGELEYVRVFGSDYNTPDGTGVRDYIHVCDLAKGHVLSLNKLEENPGLFICNLGTGKGTSVLEIIKAYMEATGVKIAYKIEGRRRGDVPINYASIDKAKKELNFKPQYNIKDACLDGYNFQIAEKKRSLK